MAQEQVAAKGGPRGKPPTLGHLLKLASCAVHAIIIPLCFISKVAGLPIGNNHKISFSKSEFLELKYLQRESESLHTVGESAFINKYLGGFGF